MKLLVLPGDGIGPEITRATLAVLDAASARFGLGLEYEQTDFGFASLEKVGTTLPDGVLERAREVDGILLGPISHLDYPPREQGGINVSGAFRVKLDLNANVRPARTRPGLGHTRVPMDLVIMREATEGFYPARNMYLGSGEFMPTPDVALSVRKMNLGLARISRIPCSMPLSNVPFARPSAKRCRTGSRSAFVTGRRYARRARPDKIVRAQVASSAAG